MFDDMTLARFWSKVDKRGPDECWLWKGTAETGGYGSMAVCGTAMPASHIALEIDGRPRPGNARALHSCDNPPCKNPAHLRWGTAKENTGDMYARKRQNFPIGERHGHAKLTEDDVRYIRSCGKTLKELCAEFNMSICPISFARRRVTWKHVA